MLSHMPSPSPGEALGQMMLARGLTLDALCRNTGLGEPMLRRVLRGREPISLDLAFRLELATGWSYS